MIGYTVEYVTVTVVTGVMLIVVSVTPRLGVYLVLSALGGAQRAVFNVVSIAVLSNIVHEEAKLRGDGKSPQLGMGMSLIFLSLPLSYCTLYPWVGALTVSTGVLASPLLLSATCAFVTSAIFCLLGV
ncbi:hypothetical protein ACOMHN_062514 [Nucella lapillus]